MADHGPSPEELDEVIPDTDEGTPPLEHAPTLKRFLHHDMVGSGLLLLSAIAALLTVNLGGAEWYHHLWETPLQVGTDAWGVEKPLHYWVNDGLMAIFFFVVGLEIKRELLAGELASLRRAALPAGAALGGMIVPAAIYAIVNYGGEGAHGWGIPMATDIAFAAGCLALMKRWVPPALMVFLVALAIVDDLGAVTVIAVFYTERVELGALEVGAALIILSFVLAQFGVRKMWPYALFGIIIWVAFLRSGIHATIAGVLLAFAIPHTARYRTHNFAKRMRRLVDRFDKAEEYWEPGETKRIHEVMVNGRQQSLLRSMSSEIHHVEAPLQRLEHNLEPFIVFFILPVFAYANAGVQIEWGHIGETLTEPVTLGILLGLVIGKPLGVTLASWIMIKTGIAELPRGVNWTQVLGVGMLAGIGFTMALFINELAFIADPETAAKHVTEGKIGIFFASIVAALLGLLFVRLGCREAQPEPTEKRPLGEEQPITL